MYHDLVHLCSACKLYAPLTEVQWYSTLNMIKCVTENLRFLHETVRKLVLVFIFTDFHCQAWEWGESSNRPKWVGSWRSGQVHWRHRHAQWQVWVVGYCGEMCQSDAGTSVSLSQFLSVSLSVCKVLFVYDWECKKCPLYREAGCPLFRSCLSIERQSGKCVQYIVDVRYWRKVSTKWSSTVVKFCL